MDVGRRGRRPHDCRRAVGGGHAAHGGDQGRDEARTVGHGRHVIGTPNKVPELLTCITISNISSFRIQIEHSMISSVAKIQARELLSPK